MTINKWASEVLGYSFREEGLLIVALTHSSFVNEGSADSHGSVNNERLEFLGDAVLELATSEHIYKTYPELSEGEMTKLRASIVCEPTLTEAAKTLDLGGHMRIGKGEASTGGRQRGSILADCYESIAGAIFLDGGYPSAKDFIIRSLEELISSKREVFLTLDFKTHLQELVQKDSKEPLEYKVAEEIGPAHNRTYVVDLFHLGKKLSRASGRSKKEAEQECARQAIRFFE